VLIDGERNSGKTQERGACSRWRWPSCTPAPANPLPLRALWLHSSLTNAKAKTVPSLQQAHWGGAGRFATTGRRRSSAWVAPCWCRRCSWATQDQTAAERLRAEAHVVEAEEVIPSLDETGGISDAHFDFGEEQCAAADATAGIAVVVTNPGDEMTWPYSRFNRGRGPGGLRAVSRAGVGSASRRPRWRAQIADFAVQRRTWRRGWPWGVGGLEARRMRGGGHTTRACTSARTAAGAEPGSRAGDWVETGGIRQAR
jgi:hypothetical protein